MGCSFGDHNMNALEDEMRIRKCEKKETLLGWGREKKQSKVRRGKRKGMRREEQAVDEEGTTYKAGAFSTTFFKNIFGY